MIHFWDTAFFPMFFAAFLGLMAVAAFFAARAYKIGDVWRRRTWGAFWIYLAASGLIVAELVLDVVFINAGPWRPRIQAFAGIVSVCQPLSLLAAIAISLWHVFLKMREQSAAAPPHSARPGSRCKTPGKPRRVGRR